MTVEQINPAALLLDLNVRADAALDKDFLASVRELGVLVPVVAVRTGDGRLRVRHGHRRTLAAAQALCPSVPVVIVGDEDADDVARIIGQWHENEHRAGLSTADELAAVQQLSLLGLSPAQIARRTKTGKDDVTQALTAASSGPAKEATTKHGFLTLDHAAALAEFDSNPDTVTALITAASNSDGDFRHVLQRARDNREEKAQATALAEQLTAAGITVIDRPDHTHPAVKALSELAGDDGAPLDADTHATCPGARRLPRPILARHRSHLGLRGLARARPPRPVQLPRRRPANGRAGHGRTAHRHHPQPKK